jgi:hypothetical protein
MNKFAMALAAVVSLGLAIPAFAEGKTGEKMGGDKMGKHGTMVVHHHHHHPHHHHDNMMGKPEPKPQ